MFANRDLQETTLGSDAGIINLVHDRFDGRHGTERVPESLSSNGSGPGLQIFLFVEKTVFREVTRVQTRFNEVNFGPKCFSRVRCSKQKRAPAEISKRMNAGIFARKNDAHVRSRRGRSGAGN